MKTAIFRADGPDAKWQGSYSAQNVADIRETCHGEILVKGEDVSYAEASHDGKARGVGIGENLVGIGEEHINRLPRIFRRDRLNDCGAVENASNALRATASA